MIPMKISIAADRRGVRRGKAFEQGIEKSTELWSKRVAFPAKTKT